MQEIFAAADSAATWRLYRSDRGCIRAEITFDGGLDARGTIVLESHGSGLEFGIVERYADPNRPDGAFCGAFDLFNVKTPSTDPLFACNPQIIVGEPGGDNVVHIVLMPDAPVVYLPKGVEEHTSPDGETKFYAYPYI